MLDIVKIDNLLSLRPIEEIAGGFSGQVGNDGKIIPYTMDANVWGRETVIFLRKLHIEDGRTLEDITNDVELFTMLFANALITQTESNI
jgi:hypothetical protein